MNQNFPIRRTCAAVLAGAVAVPFMAMPASAKGTEIGGDGERYFLNNDADSTGTQVIYGRADDRSYVGDWNGDGVDSFGVRRGNHYLLTNGFSGGAEIEFRFGKADDEALVGDWDGDGVDTLAVRRGNVFHFSNSLSDGAAETTITYGQHGDQVLVGDWNGDGKDTLAVRRGEQYHLKNSIDSGPADEVVTLAGSGEVPISGDWDGDGRDEVGHRVDHVAHMRMSDGSVRSQSYGRTGDQIFTGDWDGNGTDTLAVRRPSPKPAPAPAPAPAAPQVQSSTGEAVLAAARSRIGGAYRWGGSGPTAFDCSGLTAYAYAAVGVSLPHQSSAQRNFGAAHGRQVSLAEARPGDLVWYPGHVAIYAGNGKIVDAANPALGISERRIYGSPQIFRIV